MLHYIVFGTGQFQINDVLLYYYYYLIADTGFMVTWLHI